MTVVRDRNNRQLRTAPKALPWMKEAHMGVFDKAKDKAEQAVGKGKERLGEATDNEDLENAGQARSVPR